MCEVSKVRSVTLCDGNVMGTPGRRHDVRRWTAERDSLMRVISRCQVRAGAMGMAGAHRYAGYTTVCATTVWRARCYWGRVYLLRLRSGTGSLPLALGPC